MQDQIEIVSAKMFREPEGLKMGLVNLGLAATCVVLWASLAYFGIIVGEPEGPSPFLLINALLFGLVGIAESLPSSQRRLAGTLRIIGVSIPIATLIHLALVPEFYLS